ncbi:MAG: beta-ketoacyl-ACP synthase III [Acidimicrobiales bacterium]
MTGPVQLSAPTGSYAHILGVGGYRPARVVTNDEIVQRIDSSDEWIRERSGIVTRHAAADDESVVDMSVAAAGKALAHAGVTADQIDTVIVATVTHLWQTPSAAAIVGHRLGATGAAAFDISAACAGFCHGLALANDLVRGGTARHVLVVGVEKLTDMIDPNDRGTAFLCGDGAGAAVVGPSETPGIGPVVWGADGGQAEAITQDASWDVLRDDPEHKFPTLSMNGQQVFRWAVFQMAPVCEQALEAAGVTADQLDAFIPHQANLRIVEAMVKKLGLPEHVAVARDIVSTGNTSAASIPLAMERMIDAGEAPHGGLALLIGFGAGLAFAAQVVVLP